MIGKVISITNMTERYDEVVIQELESNALLTTTVSKGSCDHYISQYVSVFSEAIRLANANAGHRYPEGTLGWDKKGF